MIEFLKELFFARKCLICGDVLLNARGQIFCPTCRLQYEEMKTKTCKTCGKEHQACRCMSEKLQGEVAHAHHLFAYGNAISKIILYTLKRRDYRMLQEFLGGELSALLSAYEDYDISYAPRKPKSVREFGFDQAKSLAEVISDELDLPLVELFVHAHRSELQKNLSAEERRENAEKSYKLRRFYRRENKNLILVDDVMTTGSTMAKLVSLAKEAGYQNIVIATVARTVHEKEDI